MIFQRNFFFKKIQIESNNRISSYLRSWNQLFYDIFPDIKNIRLISHASKNGKVWYVLDPKYPNTQKIRTGIDRLCMHTLDNWHQSIKLNGINNDTNKWHGIIIFPWNIYTNEEVEWLKELLLENMWFYIGSKKRKTEFS